MQVLSYFAIIRLKKNKIQNTPKKKKKKKVEERHGSILFNNKNKRDRENKNISHEFYLKRPNLVGLMASFVLAFKTSTTKLK